MTDKNIVVDKKGRVTVITFDHPPANAWDLATVEEFERAVDLAERDTDTRAVVLTGAEDRCFSAGFDVKDAANAGLISPKARDLWTRIHRFPKPVIAAINGYALGGGLELALCCHFRIMKDSPDTTVGLTELNLGIIPGWGGTQRLPLLVGRSRALEMILLSRRIGAREALNMGLVNRISPPESLMEDALDLARELAERPPIAVSCVLEAMSVGEYEGLDRGLEVEAEGTVRVRGTRDREEGFRAFIEKRKPVFTGE